MRKVLGWTLGLALAATPGQALSPNLAEDINPTATPASSSPQSFVPVGNVVAFIADDPVAGRNLWRSDGTAKGTYPLITGCDHCFTQWYDLTPSSAFFLGSDRSGASALWMTSGTPETTLPLVSGLPGGYSVSVPEQGLYYFDADDGVHGEQLWRTDGTVAGTFRVTDLAPGVTDSAGPRPLTDFGGELFFSANDGSGFGLWKTDGTERGTRLVKNVVPGERSSSYELAAIGVVGRWLVFAANSPGVGYKLWRSDGTARGTVPLRKLVPGGSPTFYGFFPLGERLLFAADTGQGANLWVTDGTNPGTRQLTHFTSRQPFIPNFDRYSITTGGRLFFPADDGIHGRELWTSDGTPAGTHLVSDVCPGPCSSDSYPNAVAGGRLFFSANDGIHGRELWSTDGTSGGTRLLEDICPGSCSSDAYVVGVLGSRVVLKADDGRTGLQLWRTDGTASGTARITGFAAFTVFPIGIDSAVAGGSLLLFAGEDAAHGIELWRSDGTRAGTYLLEDIAKP